MKGVWKNFEEKMLYIYDKKLLQNEQPLSSRGDDQRI